MSLALGGRFQDGSPRRADYRKETGPREDRARRSRATVVGMPAPLDPEMFDPMCPSSALPFRIGDKWTGMIVLCLQDGPRRFGELRVPLAGITAKVLAETLRAMRRDGLVSRTVYEENPPRVEYALTPLGRSLLTLIDAARAWSREHLATLLRERARSTEAAGPAGTETEMGIG